MNNLLRGLLTPLLFTLPMASLLAQEATDTPVAPRPAKVIKVVTGDTGLSRQYPAIVYPSQEAELSFRVSGQVVDLPVRAATGVKKGGVIAELDKRDFKTSVARLESQRDQAQAQLDALVKGARAEEIVALQAGVYAAQAKVDQAREQTLRTRQLFEKEIVAAAQLEKDEATLRVAHAELRTAEEELIIGQSGGREEDIAAAEAVLRGLEVDVQNARDSLNDATLRAPFDGVVARRDIDSFNNIQAGQAIVLLQNLNTIDLVFDVPSSDVLTWSAFDWNQVQVQVELTGSSQPLTAKDLVEFSTQADAGTQTYQARVSVDVPDGVRVLSGMVGRVRVSVQNAEELRPVVPITALATTPDGNPFVWLVDPASNALTARPVTTGTMSGSKVSIETGLEAGDLVVTAGVSRLSEGLVIRPISKVGN
ncbi:MAG: multidrug efflux system membrane fusion protein [Paracoccaceae bacterium]|jgi:multidrug efflux system membrane fusion protein